MPGGYDWPTFNALQGALATLSNIDEHAEPLMEQWEGIIIEGNRRGVLAGLDGNNQPMPPLKYRDGKGKRTRNRKVPDFGTSLYESSSAGPYATGLNDNLTTAQYQELTGPRLAPRKEASRAIKNLMTEIRHYPAEKRWEAVGAWYQVVSYDGTPFLPYHFEGMGHNPRYDLRPVRPEDLQFAINALRAFIKANFLDRF